MICLQTTDDWETPQITMDDGGGGQVFTPSADVLDAYSAALEFVDWVDGAFGETTVMSWGRDEATAGGEFTFTFTTNTYTMSSNAAAQSLLGVAASGGPGLTSLDWTAPSGTLGARSGQSLTAPRVERWQRWHDGAGVGGASGISRGAVAGKSAYRPTITWPGQALDFARLTSQAANVRNPRRAYVYDTRGADWRLVSWGAEQAQRTSPSSWSFSVDVRG